MNVVDKVHALLNMYCPPPPPPPPMRSECVRLYLQKEIKSIPTLYALQYIATHFSSLACTCYLSTSLIILEYLLIALIVRIVAWLSYSCRGKR